MTEARLKTVFEPFGEVERVYIISSKSSIDRHKSSKVGYVIFKDGASLGNVPREGVPIKNFTLYWTSYYLNKKKRNRKSVYDVEYEVEVLSLGEILKIEERLERLNQARNPRAKHQISIKPKREATKGPRDGGMNYQAQGQAPSPQSLSRRGESNHGPGMGFLQELDPSRAKAEAPEGDLKLLDLLKQQQEFFAKQQAILQEKISSLQHIHQQPPRQPPRRLEHQPTGSQHPGSVYDSPAGSYRRVRGQFHPEINYPTERNMGPSALYQYSSGSQEAMETPVARPGSFPSLNRVGLGHSQPQRPNLPPRPRHGQEGIRSQTPYPMGDLQQPQQGSPQPEGLPLAMRPQIRPFGHQSPRGQQAPFFGAANANRAGYGYSEAFSGSRQPQVIGHESWSDRAARERQEHARGRGQRFNSFPRDKHRELDTHNLKPSKKVYFSLSRPYDHSSPQDHSTLSNLKFNETFILSGSKKQSSVTSK